MPESQASLNILQDDLKRRKLPTAVKRAVTAMLDKQGERITVLKLMSLSDITDYLIVCTGNSTRQNAAIADEITACLGKELKVKPFNQEGTQPGEWILIDFIDFIVHIFIPEQRDRYALEKMWMDAKRYDFFID